MASVARHRAGVKLVVAADKLHNARSLLQEHRRLGEALWAHFRGEKAGTLWYYRAALEAVRDGAAGRPGRATRGSCCEASSAWPEVAYMLRAYILRTRVFFWPAAQHPSDAAFIADCSSTA